MPWPPRRRAPRGARARGSRPRGTSARASPPIICSASVDALEPAPARDRDLTEQPEVLEAVLHGIPVPPRTSRHPAQLVVELRRAERSARGRRSRTHCTIAAWWSTNPSVPGPFSRIARNAKREQAPVPARDERRFVRPVLGEGGAARHQHPVEAVGVIGTQSREQREIVRAGEDVDRIDLQRGHALQRACPRAAGPGGGASAAGRVRPNPCAARAIRRACARLSTGSAERKAGTRLSLRTHGRRHAGGARRRPPVRAAGDPGIPHPAGNMRRPRLAG